MPLDYIHTPWLCPDKMNGYPMPIVDEKIARKLASDKIYAIRKNLDHEQDASRIVTKHVGCKSAVVKKVNKSKTNKKAQPIQEEFKF